MVASTQKLIARLRRVVSERTQHRLEALEHLRLKIKEQEEFPAFDLEVDVARLLVSVAEKSLWSCRKRLQSVIDEEKKSVKTDAELYASWVAYYKRHSKKIDDNTYTPWTPPKRIRSIKIRKPKRAPYHPKERIQRPRNPHLLALLRDTIEVFRIIRSNIPSPLPAVSDRIRSIMLRFPQLFPYVDGLIEEIPMKDLTLDPPIDECLDPLSPYPSSDVYCSPTIAHTEMESQSAQGQNTASLAKAGNVVLTDTSESSQATTSSTSIQGWQQYTTSDTVDDFSTFVDRWFLTKNFEWSSSQQQGHLLSSFFLPEECLNSDSTQKGYSPNLLPFYVNRYARYDMEVKVQVNSNKFQIGQLQVSWLYVPDLDDKVSLRENIWTLSQTSHALVSASSSNEACLTIPYASYAPFLPTKHRPDYVAPNRLGKVYIFVMNPLTSPDTVDNKASVSVFVRFTNCQFTGLQHGSIDASAEMDTVVKAESILHNLLADPNRDNPPDPTPAPFLVPKSSTSWAAGTGVSEPQNPLRLDPCGTTPHPDNQLSETKIASLAKTFGFVNTLTWTKDLSYGHMICDFAASPLMDLKTYKKDAGKNATEADIYYLPPIAILSSMNAYWRGEIEFRFDFIASQFHSGRLLVAYIPGTTSRTHGVTLEIARSSPHVVFDLQEQHQFSFVAPFISDTAYWPRTHSVEDTRKVYAPSRIYMFVLNPLIPMQSVSNSVFINVYVRGGDSFEVAIPVQPSVGLPFNRIVGLIPSEGIRAHTDSFPYYFGSYHNISSVQCARVKATSNGVSYFDSKYENLFPQPLKGIYYKCSGDFAKIWDPKKKLYLEVKEGILYPDGSSGFVLIPVRDGKGSTVAIALKDKVPSEALLQSIEKYSYSNSFSTTGNSWTEGNPLWIPVLPTLDFEVVSSGEGEETKDLLPVNPTNSMSSQRCDRFMFGESFEDLKDYCRRYQLYTAAVYNFKPGQPGQIGLILPILPQRLDLQIIDKSDPDKPQIIQVSNRCRDGIIPLVLSGYRFYRGSVNLRAVISDASGLVFYAQHRPDDTLEQTKISQITDYKNVGDVVNFGYANELITSQVNGVLSMNIPFYQPGSFGLLQRPKIVNSLNVNKYMSLGSVAFGFLPQNLGQNRLDPVHFHYCLGDDFNMSVFQGFPPMIVLDTILPITAKSEMGMVDKVVEQVSTSMSDTVSQKVDDFTKATAAKIDGLVSSLEAKLPTGASFLNNSITRSLLTNLAHIINSQNLKSILIAVISLFAEIGLSCLTFSQKFINCIHKIIANLLSNKEESSPSEQRIGDEEPIKAEAQMEVSVSVKVFSTLAGLLWVGLGSYFGIKSMRKLDCESFAKLLSRDLGGVFRGASAVMTFITNVFETVKTMVLYLINRISPDVINIKDLEKAHATVKQWASEVIELTDPAILSELPYDPTLVDRVFSAYVLGQAYATDQSICSIPNMYATISRLFERIEKAHADCVKMGKDPLARKMPFTIFLHGKPGIGKSSIQNDVCLDLLKSVQYTTNRPMTFIWQPTSQYWDQYDGQPVMAIDDLWNIQTGELLERQIATLFSVHSPVVLCPPMAHLEDKKRRANFEIFWINSNVPFPNIPNVDKNAIFRRRDVLIECKPVEEMWYTVTGKAYDQLTPKEKALHKNALSKENCPHCHKNVKINSCDPEFLEDYHHLLFRFYKDVCDPNSYDNEWLTYAEMMALLRRRFVNAWSRNAKMFAKQVSTMAQLKPAAGSGPPGALEAYRTMIKERLTNMANEAVTSYNMWRTGVFEAKARQESLDWIYNNIRSSSKLFAEAEKIEVQAQVHDVPITVEEIEQTLAEVAESQMFSIFKKKEKPKSNLKDDDFSAVPDEIKTVSTRSFTFPKSFEALENYVTESHMYGLDKRVDIGLKIMYHWCDTNIITQDMVTEALNLSIDVDPDRNYFYYIISKGKDEIEKSTFFTWNAVLDLLRDKVPSDMCHHFYTDPTQITYVVGIGTLYKGKVMLTCEDENCCLSHPIIFAWFWRSVLCGNPCLMGHYNRKEFEHLPKEIRPSGEILHFPDLTTWVGWIKYKIQELWKNYLSPAMWGIINFFKSHWPVLLPVMAVILPMLATTMLIHRDLKNAEPDPTYWAKVNALESKWSTGESGVKYSTPSKVNMNTKVPVASSQSETPQVEVVMTRVRDSLFTVTAMWEDKVLKATFVVIKGREAIILRHYDDEFLRLPPNAVYYGKYDNMTSKVNPLGIEFNYRSCVRKWYSYPEHGDMSSNIGVIHLPMCFHESKDLTRFIATADSHRFSNGVGLLAQTNGRSIDNMRIQQCTRTHNVVSDSGEQVVTMRSFYKYSAHSKGFCGSLLIAQNMECPIIGIHVAGVGGSSGYGMAEPLTREMFVDIVKPIRNFVAPDLDSLESAKISFDTVLYPYGTVTKEYSQTQGGDTQFIPSQLHGVFEVRTEPNPLTKSDRRLPKGSDPLKLGVEHKGKPPIDFPQKLVDDAIADLTDTIIGAVKPVRSQVGVIDFETAVVGNVNIDGFRPLEWTTSEGFPLKAQRPKNAKGKSWLFDLELTAQGHAVKAINPEFRRLYGHEMSLRKQGVRPFTVFTDCLKDDVLPSEKCKIPGKTRIFSIAPVQFTVAFKQYFLDFMASYQDCRIASEHAIGTNEYSTEWTRIAHYLQETGDKIIAGDYKNFGPGLLKQVAQAASEVILNWYSHHGASDAEQCIRRVMLEEVVDAWFLVENLIYKAPCGIPSGSPITTPLNSLVNSLYIRVMWKLITRRSFVDMHSHIRILTYGDDVCIGVSDEFSETFNTVTLESAFSRFNIVFTDAEKTGEIVKYRTLSGVSFLKRNFVEHPTRKGLYLANLDKKSVEGCVNWIKRTGNFTENSIVNSQMAARLAFGWGPTYYNKIVSTLKSAWYHNDEQVKFYTWTELDQEIFGNDSAL